MRKCSLDKMNDVFAAVASSKTLYLPVDGSDGNAVYTRWAEGVKWSEQLNTVRSPKHSPMHSAVRLPRLQLCRRMPLTSSTPAPHSTAPSMTSRM